jgi:hypothetical protein
MRYYVGVAETAHCQHFERAMISVNRLMRRKKPFIANEWIMDSGAFTAVARDGGYKTSVEEYAAQIRRFATTGKLIRAAAQDYMCEPFVLTRTGLSLEEHQRLTTERFHQLAKCDTANVQILPTLQGYDPADYARHVHDYGPTLTPQHWVGVGSVCKRNSNPAAVYDVLRAIKEVRPDLRLHGFGLKITALENPQVRALLYSADSMAWSLAARREGRNANDWREAKSFETRVRKDPAQTDLFN